MATKQNYSVGYGNVGGRYNLNTSVSVSGNKINWNASIQFVDGTNADKVGVRVYDSGEANFDTTNPWDGFGETSGATGSFSGSWSAKKTSGTVSFYLDFYYTDNYGYVNRSTVILTDGYSGATIYEAPSCNIVLQSSAIYAGSEVSLRCTVTGGTPTTGTIKRYYKASGASGWTNTTIQTNVTRSGTVSDTIPSNYNGGQVYWRYDVSDGTSSDYAQTTTYTVASNSAPSIPASLTVPDGIAAGSSFSISWGKSTDPDGNLAGYILERSTNGGATWTQVYKGTARSTTDTLISGTSRVRYRVCAYDTYDAQSGYRPAPDSGDITVTNNHAPTVPSSPITITPASLMVGVQAVISWGLSTDEDEDPFEYVLERSVDNLTSYTEIYRGTTRNYTDAVGSWSTVSYRVKAVDSHGASSGYLTAETKVVSTNNAPTITCSHDDGEDLGTKSAVFSFTYQVNDENAADTLTIKEIVDGVVKKTINNAVRNQNYTFNFRTGSASSTAYWNKVLNGSHTITISVTDGAVTVSRTFTFLKNVGACLITMTEAIESTRNIEKVALSICGSIPAGGFKAVQVTADDGTHWEDCILASGTGVTESGIGNRKKKATGALTEELLGGHYLFIHTMTNTGKKFNFRIQAEKVGNDGGYISSVQGTFTEVSA